MILTYTETCYTALKYFFEIEYFCVINKNVVIQHFIKIFIDGDNLQAVVFFVSNYHLKIQTDFLFFFSSWLSVTFELFTRDISNLRQVCKKCQVSYRMEENGRHLCDKMQNDKEQQTDKVTVLFTTKNF